MLFLTPLPLNFLIDRYLDFWRAQRRFPESLMTDQKSTARRCLELLQSASDPFTRDHFPGHFTASALITTGDFGKVLLTHHRKLDKWLQLGGHADGDRDLIAVALREAREESGLKDLKLVSYGDENQPDWHVQIVDLDIHTIPKNPREPMHFHFDVRFVLVTSEPQSIVLSSESHDLQWFTAEQAHAVCQEASLSRLIDKMRYLHAQGFLIHAL